MTSSDARPISSEEPAGELTGRIFDVQRWSLNDGAGIRTVVFFKGCPLTCPWCSNPESRATEIEYVRRGGQCLHCSVCLRDPAECPSGAYRAIGRDVGLDELEAEIARDAVFHRVSGGGVTLSGGEVLMQGRFAVALLARLRAKGIATAVETTGHGSHSLLMEIGRLSDEVLYDFKIMDPIRARAVLGISLDLALDGFASLVAAGVRVIPRLPLVPGYTMTEDNLEAVLAFLKPFGLRELHLLPLHHYGAAKYEMLGQPYAAADIAVPAEEDVARWRRRCESEGYDVSIGG